jgi:hypothetical protein
MDNSEKSPTLETKKTALHNSDLVKQTPVNKTVTENIAKCSVFDFTFMDNFLSAFIGHL